MGRYLHWFIAGVAIGLLNILSYAVKKPLGVSTSFVTAGAIGVRAIDKPLVDKNPYLKEHAKVDYQFILVVAMALGGLVSSRLFGRSAGNPGRTRSIAGIIRQLAGGFLMLFGARIGKGCTSGNILSGDAQMSLGSMLFSLATFVAGALTLLVFGDRR
ncbi:conserved hypothetical protein [Methanocella paludicola SANAE]|uniref:Uncharacterized protein n=1 Tax=Methanocella paludicola (strain DSM 17711 / JCM 13418 / NBRC 101707 / SANAE) TaxID=304371 RepID=D1YY32_METPS|nr:YeeE/YedE thiosulfate transporter family protein [Methanocella paludicola]BAI61354.1 conserved hypothetical protein [Methanocella paludicola SANAE]